MAAATAMAPRVNGVRQDGEPGSVVAQYHRLFICECTRTTTTDPSHLAHQLRARLVAPRPVHERQCAST